MRRVNNILAGTIALLGATALLWAADASAPPAATRPAETSPAPRLPLLTPDLKNQFWFGVAVENIPPSIARQLKLKPSQGLMVSAVLPDSPAEKAGIKIDDLLIEINERPLTSQDDLFRAANSATRSKTEIIPKPSHLVFLREGDRIAVDIIPAPRPQNMIVFEGAGSGNQAQKIKVRNYVDPNGGGAQIGPGIRLNLAASDPSDFTAKSIRAIVSKGQTVILSQETDVLGNVKNTITVGSTVYTVDPLHLDALPAELRPLAQQLINGSPTAPTPPPTATATAPSLEQRVKDLEAQNAELRRQVEGLLHSKP